MNIFDNFTKKELENVLHKYTTWREITSELGAYDKHNKMVPLLKRKLDELNIDYSFIDNTPIRRRKDRNRNKFTMLKDEEIFFNGSDVSPFTVKKAFLRHTEIPYECSICGLPPLWQGKDLTLTMDHIDGDSHNNELSNLRWVCPNCDRQLPTYCGKNKNRIYKKDRITVTTKTKTNNITYKNVCPQCGNLKTISASLCEACSRLGSRKIEKPSRDILKNEIRTMPFLIIGKKYNVSDNAVRKWCKTYDLPFRVSDIKNISDEEWEKI